MSNEERPLKPPTTQFDDLSRSATIATEADNLTFDVELGVSVYCVVSEVFSLIN